MEEPSSILSEKIFSDWKAVIIYGKNIERNNKIFIKIEIKRKTIRKERIFYLANARIRKTGDIIN